MFASLDFTMIRRESYATVIKVDYIIYKFVIILAKHVSDLIINLAYRVIYKAIEYIKNPKKNVCVRMDFIMKT